MAFSVARPRHAKEIRVLGIGLLILPIFLALTVSAQTRRVVIVQTNSAGDSVH